MRLGRRRWSSSWSTGELPSPSASAAACPRASRCRFARFRGGRLSHVGPDQKCLRRHSRCSSCSPRSSIRIRGLNAHRSFHLLLRGFCALKVERTSQLTRGAGLSNPNVMEQYKVESGSAKIICGWDDRTVIQHTRIEVLHFGHFR
ncbi:uncharacterized protein SCHCODRAFT_02174202 [Schizophyllum commune H4-8]|uniref:uncharacterized protein n=1 Tax=Schizophyllum commune (strain H4-8 / FGSC 9210) TaxID=578458 RepID=UPI0021602DB8|nr:uncharacterized protein SCHCODRAFT_02174202 [Schizophyllum commune H4-8]KAI5898801.1 hypothetical protein SCHCODRAFT_02174202 [Schizophyllum commune H4-8]